VDVVVIDRYRASEKVRWGAAGLESRAPTADYWLKEAGKGENGQKKGS